MPAFDRNPLELQDVEREVVEKAIFIVHEWAEANPDALDDREARAWRSFLVKIGFVDR